MKRLLLVFMLLACPWTGQAQKEESDNRAGVNRNKPEREEWLRDLGFGLFIHFSFDSQLGVVISHSLVGASDDYTNRFLNELPKTFDPYKYDAYRMAVQAKLAGARYICLTAKHHSGFCLWDTQTTDLKITNTPYGRDLLKEYVEGARRAGLAVGLYYSPEDFRFLVAHGIPVQRGGITFTKDVAAAYDDLVRRQTRELFMNYGKIDMLFIDGEPKEPCKDEAWKLQPDVVITRGAVNTPEQTVPGIATDRLWESNLTMGTQWQYKPTNDELKSGTRLIEILVEVRAKGGNLLLNVGPRPDGVIADPEERRLTEIAAWHFINQEAIHDVRPWVIPHEEGIWFTAAKDRKTVYAVITGIPDWARGARKEFVLGSIKATPQTRISVLGQNDKVTEYMNNVDVKSRFTAQADGLHLSVVRAQRIYNNSKWPNPITVKLEHVEPALVPPVFETVGAQVGPGKVVLRGRVVALGDAGELKVGFESRPYAGFVENMYSKTWQRVAGEVTLKQPGEFSLEWPAVEKGKAYEYRAVVRHPRMMLYGDNLRFTAK